MPSRITPSHIESSCCNSISLPSIRGGVSRRKAARGRGFKLFFYVI